jgi:hypothetical protein
LRRNDSPSGDPSERAPPSSVAEERTLIATLRSSARCIERRRARAPLLPRASDDEVRASHERAVRWPWRPYPSVTGEAEGAAGFALSAARALPLAISSSMLIRNPAVRVVNLAHQTRGAIECHGRIHERHSGPVRLVDRLVPDIRVATGVMDCWQRRTSQRRSSQYALGWGGCDSPIRMTLDRNGASFPEGWQLSPLRNGDDPNVRSSSCRTVRLGPTE